MWVNTNNQKHTSTWDEALHEADTKLTCVKENAVISAFTIWASKKLYKHTFRYNL